MTSDSAPARAATSRGDRRPGVPDLGGRPDRLLRGFPTDGPEEWAVRAGRLLGSWTYTAVTVVLVAMATVLSYRYGGDRGVAVLDAVLLAVVLAELPLLIMLVHRADRTAAELAIHQLESDTRMAAEIRELGDTQARLAVELARLNARLRTTAPREPGQEGKR